MRRLPVVGLLLALACGHPERSFAPTWGVDEAAVLLIVREDGSAQTQLLSHGLPFWIEVDRSEQIYLLIFEQTSDLDFASCGIELGDAHPLGKTPLRVLTADPRAEGSVLAPIDDPLRWPRPALSYLRCDDRPFDCRNWHGTISPGPIGLPEVNDLAILDAEAIFYIARANVADPGEYRLVRYDGQVHHLFDASVVRGSFKTLAIDGERVWVSSEIERVAFDRNGTKVATETATAGLSRVAAGGGARIKYGRSGLVALEGRIDPRRDDVKEAVVLSESRILIITSSTVEDWDGARWNVVLPRRPNDRWNAGGSDDDLMLAVEDSGTVIFRETSSTEWETRDGLFGLSTNLRGATGLGAGRFVVTGKVGILGIYDGESPCRVPPPPEVRDYFKPLVTPDGRQLVVLARGVGSSELDTPALVIFPIPQKR